MLNEEFQRLYRDLIDERIDTTRFLSELPKEGDFRGELLDAMHERYQLQDWRNLGRLIWAVGLLPDRMFTELLCDVLDNHKHDEYMEAVADALIDISDEHAVPCIVRALNYRVEGDSGCHFNRKLINALFKIGTKEAVEGMKQALNSREGLIRESAKDFLKRLPQFSA